VNLMRLLLALFIMAMLSFSASAATENATTGPYMVSFDMNTTLNYTVQAIAPYAQEFRTAYPLLIETDNNSRAQITIFEYSKLMDSTPDLWQTINAQGLSLLGLTNITPATEMTVDGKPAYGLSARDSNNNSRYSANYWLDSTDCNCGPVSVGKINVVIFSAYPLNITASILDSMHVELISQSMSGKSLTFAPPKTQ